MIHRCEILKADSKRLQHEIVETIEAPFRHSSAFFQRTPKFPIFDGCWSEQIWTGHPY